jgi:hypothetical protein
LSPGLLQLVPVSLHGAQRQITVSESCKASGLHATGRNHTDALAPVEMVRSPIQPDVVLDPFAAGLCGQNHELHTKPASMS